MSLFSFSTLTCHRNREMQLEDGRFVVHPDRFFFYIVNINTYLIIFFILSSLSIRFDELLLTHSKEELLEKGLVKAHRFSFFFENNPL